MYTVIHTSVFPLAPGGGNPCPVVLDADALSPEEMQRMTAEFGRESAFVLRPTAAACDVRLRYFVPLHEMEMCCHATIAAVTVLVDRGVFTRSPVRVETRLGPVYVEWSREEGHILVGVHQFLPKVLDRAPTPEEVCAALRIAPCALLPQPICSVATSRYKLMVPLRETETLNRLEPDFDRLWSLCDQYQTTGFYPFARACEGGDARYYARQFPCRAGYNEDPATGVAASALSAYLARIHADRLHDGWNHFDVVQGVAMGKPSIIRSSVRMEEGQVVGTRVSGQAVYVSAENAAAL